MNLKYVGNRAFGMRLAEFSCSENEEERLLRIADYLRGQGWKVDTGCELWAAIEVADRQEFDYVMDDYKDAKKIIK